ncbi:amidase [Primorskyibacter sp. S187A]|uniref:amidase n=1 Tax=Primorskyibacter sp. S187A TaxID=3415130 RepID=UPI003C7D9EAF
MQDWLTKTAAEQGRAIGRGELDPQALTDAYLEKARPRGDIYARLTEARARREAEAAARRARENRRVGPLDGVPISWKDLFDTAGDATEAGSKLLEGRVPERDAEVLRAATAQGLVCLGKTHMSELAFSGLGLNPMTGTPPNINDDGAVPGGSSSGAAASVAFGTASAGIGSDTGGSVRIPSAWNDLVGLKTTSGALSLEGVVPLCAQFDTVGPLARSVEDAALLHAAMGGGAAPDLKGVSLKGVHFAVLDTIVQDDIEERPAAAFAEALARLQDAGAQITEIDVPELAAPMALSGILFTSEAYGTWGKEIEANPDKMFPEILNRFRAGKDQNAADYVAAWQTVDQARAAWADAVAPFHAVLTPTAAIVPPNKARLQTDSDYYVRSNLLALRNTRVGNLMGLCALSLPTSERSCGLQVLGRARGEAALLRLGAAVEQALA